MILAAGRGERMGDLTRATPKPLLTVGGHYLIEYAIANFARAGIKDIVINVSFCADQIQKILGDGSRYGAKFTYSIEQERLETGGGILRALPFLGDAPFLVMSSDIITNYPLADLPDQPNALAHLVMVDNPSFHPSGDFGLQNGFANLDVQPTFTFGNIGIYRPELFKACDLSYFPLKKLLFPAIRNGQITAEKYSGLWFNIGTKKDLEEARVCQAIQRL